MIQNNASRTETKIPQETDPIIDQAEEGNPTSYTIQGNNKLKPILDRRDQAKAQETVKENDRNFESMTNVFMAATIIASITYSAAMQVPGGYNNDGIPNLESNATFKKFFLSNLIAFRFSANAVMVCLAMIMTRRLHRTMVQ